MMGRRIATAAVLMAMAFTSCSGGPSPSGTAYAKDGTFNLALNEDPGALHPLLSLVFGVYALQRFAYDTLIHIDSSGKLVSGLAEKWDGNTTRATFTLKQGISCSDGSPLKATDVASSFNFIANPKSGSPFNGIVTPPGMVAVGDDSSRTITLTSPKPFGFLLEVAGTYAPVVCPKGISDPKSLSNATAGTGPFVLTSAVPGSKYTYERRDGYAWGPNGASTAALGVPKRVVVQVVSNESTAANLLLSGGLNAAQVAGADRTRLKSAGLYENLATGPFIWTSFNEKPGRVGNDPAVRKALIMALDSKAIGKVATANYGTAPKGLLATEPRPCSNDSVTGNVPQYNPTAAGQMLDGAGWIKGSDGVRTKNGQQLAINFNYLTTFGPNMASAAELARAAWTQLGVKVSITGRTTLEMTNLLYVTKDWDALWSVVTVSYPSILVNFVSGTSPLNKSSIHNSDYESYAAQASNLTGAEACALWAKAEGALFRGGDIGPIIDGTVPFYGKYATFTSTYGYINPQSVRMLSH